MRRRGLVIAGALILATAAVSPLLVILIGGDSTQDPIPTTSLPTSSTTSTTAVAQTFSTGDVLPSRQNPSVLVDLDTSDMR